MHDAENLIERIAAVFPLILAADNDLLELPDILFRLKNEHVEQRLARIILRQINSPFS
jgi:hypothetical protein